MTSPDSLTISQKQVVNSAFDFPIELVTLKNSHGLTVSLSNLGASIWSVTVPSRHNNQSDKELVLNYQNVADWAVNPYYFGVTVGRVANRISHACFALNNKKIVLSANEGDHQLHGGPKGISQGFWSFETFQEPETVGVIYRYHSPDGDQGFLGNMDIELTYRLNNNNELTLSYQAIADQTTPINLTNHTYWNIAGTTASDILDLTLKLPADDILVLNEQQIPTGALMSVENTEFDFRESKAVGKDIQTLAHGYDHYFIINRKTNDLMQVAELVDPKSGLTMEVYSTEVGLQLYSGNFLANSHYGNDGKPLSKFKGLCLETHGYPDAVNQPNFPSIIVDKGDIYRQTTQFKFSQF
mgnify:CR=1 FL=1